MTTTELPAASMALVAGSLAAYEPDARAVTVSQSELSRLRDRYRRWNRRRAYSS